MAELKDTPVARLEADESGAARVTIVLTGELDTASAGSALGVLEQAVAIARDEIVFDMTELTFMDSSGIAVLVRAANSVEVVVLHRPNDMIRRVIEITGLSDVFRIER